MEKQSGEKEYFSAPNFFFFLIPVELYSSFSWRIFYGIQEGDLFDTYSYKSSVFLKLSTTQICKHNYGYHIICFTVVTWKSRYLFFVIFSSLHLLIINS